MTRTRTAGLVAALALVAAFPFAPALSNGFLSYDDDLYVTENPFVRAGITSTGVAWAFTTFHADNWHPLTWLSHMLDCQIFGLDPRGHHATSIVIHAAAAVLLFLALRGLTGGAGPAWVAAALFAAHPLRVESVAWIAERKDVLAGLFCALTLLAYGRYAREPSPIRYLAVAGAFAAGLLAKPTLVPLPLALLLLDAWPLGRRRGVVLEKLPLLALSAVSAALTIAAQRAGGAAAPLGAIAWTERAANAALACAVYLRKTIAPIDLSPFYPHPSVWTGGRASAALLVSGAGAAALVVGITLVALRARTARPFVATGWLWFLGMLVPTLGVVQVGMQAYADRYTYLASIGLSIVVAWGAASLAPARRAKAWTRMCLWVVLAALALGTWFQTGFWRDDVTLWSRALQVDTSNALAHNNLASALLARGRADEALTHFEQALRAQPAYADALAGMGAVLVRQGRPAEAVPLLERAVRSAPRDGRALVSLGTALLRLGERGAALARFEEATRVAPALPDAHNALGVAHMEAGELDAAARELEAALALRAEYPEAHANLGKVLRARGERAGAERHLREALRLRPDYPAALTELGVLLVEAGRAREAVPLLRRAVTLAPGDTRAREALAALPPDLQ